MTPLQELAVVLMISGIIGLIIEIIIVTNERKVKK